MASPAKVCQGCRKAWFICWPDEHGLVPLENSGYQHKKDCWHFYVKSRQLTEPEYSRERAEDDGWICVQLWLSAEKPAHYKEDKA